MAECKAPTTFDLDSIWRWCAELPPTLNFCMQELVAQQAQGHADKVAIDAWDGTLTYSQVEEYSSTLARALRTLGGVQLDDFVPLCFEKSRWTIVAVLAVMKAGGTIVMMDPSLPLARLQNMAKQVGAKTMVSSHFQTNLAQEILPEGGRFLLGPEGDDMMAMQVAFCQGHSKTHDVLDMAQLKCVELPMVPASTLMYIIFTSGSTGTPKGVKISHQTYTSSAIPRARAVGYSEASRVLDFASYAFDVSIDSMLLTLSHGGTLCIPSDEDRLNDINGVMRSMRINYAGITPSVARILDQDVIASLSALGLGGEASAPRDVNMWGEQTRIVIGYGPCECTIGCTVNSSAATGRDYISIGPGNGAAIWIVDPDNHDVLLPVGAVGELLVEGPIVGQGYLNDEAKTAAAFIHDPPWLVAGHKDHPARRGQRLYKSGDLGMYDPDGSGEIIFAGRKDTQVKLRGQRVELGEIESQLKARLPAGTHVIAEVITPQATKTASLVAFVSQHAQVNGVDDITHADLPLPAELQTALATINAEIATVLPRYMVPNAYIPVNYIPTLISGKIDRKRLRQFGVSVDLQDQEATEASTQAMNRELTDREQRLRTAWGIVLKLEPSSISLNDNFFALGGESLAAMKLVKVCRGQGLVLSVTSTFSHPTLLSMAETAQDLEGTAESAGDADGRSESLPPFSMLTSQTVESACTEAALACGTKATAIENIYPCTPTQEALVTFSLKATEVYVAQRVARVPCNVSVEALQRAWEAVVAANPILRTRVVQLSKEPGLQQVVVDEDIVWKHASNLVAYLEQDRTERMDLGQSMARYAIVVDEPSAQVHMVWTVHHVQYDGWSEPMILERVVQALASASKPQQTIPLPVQQKQMGDFVRWIRNAEQNDPGRAAMDAFWRTELRGAGGPQFPPTPSRDFLPNPDGLVERRMRIDLTSSHAPFTMATLLRGAWALVAAKYTGSDDVVFGETLTGRDIALPGVEDIWGPLNATIPIRVRISRGSHTVTEYLHRIQQGMSARAPYQHMGMQYIRRVSVDAQRACEAPTGMVVQPEPELVGSELGFELGDPVREALHFNPYPLMLAFGLQKGGIVRVCASFDSSVVSVAQMEHVLAQLEAACIEMTAHQDRKVGAISCLPPSDLGKIGSWNARPPASLNGGPVLNIENGALPSLGRGAAYPLPQGPVPWVVDPRNHSVLSPIGCPGELWLETEAFSDSDLPAPDWLLAVRGNGCKARLQPTGDMVTRRPDGSFIFVGRKEDMLAVFGLGHVLDLEANCAELLPPSVRAAAAVVPASSPSQTPLDGEEEQMEHKLVIFLGHEHVEQQQQTNGDDQTVGLLSTSHSVSCDAFSIKIRADIPLSLALALKKLDRSVREDLSSRFTPSAYVVIDTLPLDRNGAVNRKLLEKLAISIPQSVITQLHQSLTKAWETIQMAPTTTLTPAEDMLRTAWAQLLRMPAGQIDLDSNFFRLGGDSVLAMKLVSGLRSQGHGLTVANVFQHMRLRALAKVLRVNLMSVDRGTAGSAPYRAFSGLEWRTSKANVQDFLAAEVRPKLVDPGWQIQDAAGVTDSQALDILGSIHKPRTSIQYTMLYLNSSIDRQRLLDACTRLIQTHEILRTVFVEHQSTFLQIVLEQLETSVITEKTGDESLEQVVEDFCKRDAEDDSTFQLGAPFIRFFHLTSTKDDQKQCLVLRLSHAQYDGMSLPRLLSDLATLYADQSLPACEPFPAYVAHISQPSVQEKALSYWRQLLSGSKLSIISPLAPSPGEKGLFKEMIAIPEFKAMEEITTASLLTAAWALVLARRLGRGAADVTFGGVTSGRTLDDMAAAENVVGPCYQFTPIRVPFASRQQWTASELLHLVQRQSSESAAHDFVGFSTIAKQCCPQWSPASFFDSMVHHQDWDDSDSMPFAGGTANLNIINAHGDAAYPIKAVSFVRDGQLHVGVVGTERNPTFVEELLAELAATARELVDGGDELVVFG